MIKIQIVLLFILIYIQSINGGENINKFITIPHSNNNNNIYKSLNDYLITNTKIKLISQQQEELILNTDEFGSIDYDESKYTPKYLILQDIKNNINIFNGIGKLIEIDIILNQQENQFNLNNYNHSTILIFKELQQIISDVNPILSNFNSSFIIPFINTEIKEEESTTAIINGLIDYPIDLNCDLNIVNQKLTNIISNLIFRSLKPHLYKVYSSYSELLKVESKSFVNGVINFLNYKIYNILHLNLSTNDNEQQQPNILDLDNNIKLFLKDYSLLGNGGEISKLLSSIENIDVLEFKSFINKLRTLHNNDGELLNILNTNNLCDSDGDCFGDSGIGKKQVKRKSFLKATGDPAPLTDRKQYSGVITRGMFINADQHHPDGRASCIFQNDANQRFYDLSQLKKVNGESYTADSKTFFLLHFNFCGNNATTKCKKEVQSCQVNNGYIVTEDSGISILNDVEYFENGLTIQYSSNLKVCGPALNKVYRMSNYILKCDPTVTFVIDSVEETVVCRYDVFIRTKFACPVQNKYLDPINHNIYDQRPLLLSPSINPYTIPLNKNDENPSTFYFNIGGKTNACKSVAGSPIETYGCRVFKYGTVPIVSYTNAPVFKIESSSSVSYSFSKILDAPLPGCSSLVSNVKLTLTCDGSGEFFKITSVSPTGNDCLMEIFAISTHACPLNKYVDSFSQVFDLTPLLKQGGYMYSETYPENSQVYFNFGVTPTPCLSSVSNSATTSSMHNCILTKTTSNPQNKLYQFGNYQRYIIDSSKVKTNITMRYSSIPVPSSISTSTCYSDDLILSLNCDYTTNFTVAPVTGTPYKCTHVGIIKSKFICDGFSSLFYVKSIDSYIDLKINNGLLTYSFPVSGRTLNLYFGANPCIIGSMYYQACIRTGFLGTIGMTKSFVLRENGITFNYIGSMHTATAIFDCDETTAYSLISAIETNPNIFTFNYVIIIRSKYACPRSYEKLYQPTTINNPDPCIIECTSLIRNPTPIAKSITDQLIKSGVCPDQIAQYTDFDLETLFSNLWVNNKNVSSTDWSSGQLFMTLLSAVNGPMKINSISKVLTIDDSNKCIFNSTIKKSFDNLITITNQIKIIHQSSNIHYTDGKGGSLSYKNITLTTGLATILYDYKICAVFEIPFIKISPVIALDIFNQCPMFKISLVSIVPSIASVGDVLRINGNFLISNSFNVFFGSKLATVIQKEIDFITVVVPAGLTQCDANISLTNTLSGDISNSLPFTYKPQVCTTTRIPAPSVNSISDVLIRGGGICPNQIVQYTDIQLETAISNVWIDNNTIVSGDWAKSQFYKYMIANQSSSIQLYGKYYSGANNCVFNPNYNKTYSEIIDISNDFAKYGVSISIRRVLVKRVNVGNYLGLNAVYLDGKLCSIIESIHDFDKFLGSCPYTNCSFTCYDIIQQEIDNMPVGSLNKTLLSVGVCPSQINEYNYNELVEYLQERWVANSIPDDWTTGQFYYYFQTGIAVPRLGMLEQFIKPYYSIFNFCTYYFPYNKNQYKLDDILTITSDIFNLINKQIENNATRIKYNSIDTYYIPLLVPGGIDPWNGLAIVLVDFKICSLVQASLEEFDNGMVLNSCPIGPIVYNVTNPLSSIVPTPFQYSITVHGRKLEGSIITIGDDIHSDRCIQIGEVQTDPYTLLQNLTCMLPVSTLSSNFENKQIQFTNEYSKHIANQVLPSSDFFFKYPSPIITGIIYSGGNKSRVKYQESITIQGLNFFSAPNSWDKIVIEIDDIDVTYTKSNPTTSPLGIDSFEILAIGIGITNNIFIKQSSNHNNIDIPLEFKTFSFERPIVTGLSRSSGNVGELLTVYGDNFANNTIDVRFSSEIALISKYISKNEIIVIVPGGYISANVIVIAGDQSSDTDIVKFNFPNPTIDQILHRQLLNTSNINKFWIVGRGLGTSVGNFLDFKVQDFRVNCEISYCDESNDVTPPTPTSSPIDDEFDGVEDVTQDINYCPQLKSTYPYYYSTRYDLYICDFPFSVGKNISFTIPLEKSPTPYTHSYSFHVPMVIELSTNSSGTNGGNCTSFNCKDPNDKLQYLNITGVNYIPMEVLSPYYNNTNIVQQWSQDSMVTIGDYQCKNVTWVDSFNITCEIPPGLGKDLHVSVKVKGQSSTPFTLSSESKFSYKQPELDTAKRYSSPIQGGKTITIIGNQFVPKDLISKVDSSNGSVSINNVHCTEWKWINVNKVSCVVPSGKGKNLDVKVVVANQETLLNTLFSYIENNDKEPTIKNILTAFVTLLIAAVAAALTFLTIAILEAIKQASLFAFSTTITTALTILQSSVYTAGAFTTVTKKIVMSVGKEGVKKITAIGWTYMISSKLPVVPPSPLLLLSSPQQLLASNNQLVNPTSSLFNYDTYSFNIENLNNSIIECKDSNGLLKYFNSSLSCEMDINSLGINCVHMNVNWSFYQTISCNIDKTKSIVFTHPPVTTTPTPSPTPTPTLTPVPSVIGYLSSYYNDLDNYLLIYNEKSQITITDGTKKVYFPKNSTIYCSSSTLFNGVIDCFTDTDLMVHSFNNNYISYFINNYATYYYIATPPINPIVPIENVYKACYEDDEFNDGGGTFQVPTSEISQSDLQTGNDLQCESGDYEYYDSYLTSITCYNNSTGTINYDDYINYQAQTRVKICISPISS